jgi:Flp pilus assembly protein TadB
VFGGAGVISASQLVTANPIKKHKKRAEEDKRRDEQEARALKKDRLEQELEDAEWILAHEKRLAILQKKTARQRSQSEQVGANTERLRKLEHHLAGLRRSLD